ncbi:hypothetical protein T08_10419 [Trichinella sp. T8]|nr:hypothetical protein T08_10419 [Trichinella sp. T8]
MQATHPAVANGSMVHYFRLRRSSSICYMEIGHRSSEMGCQSPAIPSLHSKESD